MRLTHLRLAGFKSFVEPTNVAIPSNLVGVVGPNGCGKSNIIDAVRWVLGESKASELRGESMQDVIFNGSTNRKPAARASVELVFDNSESRVGGNWGQYDEISVKRVLTRDGSSSYYINQQHVRRRDVQDIFLGTGLGPRAYAIIGQGMIARIIESKPQDLRVFLEEAAGVSKYKERRRETANRLQDTQDNLTRVEDIVSELDGQISRLSQQAEIAQQYQSYDAQKTQSQQQLWALKLKDAFDQKNSYSAKRAHAELELEKLNSESITAQARLYSARETQIEKQQNFDAEQANWLQACRMVNQLEADVRVKSESKTRLESRARELEHETQDWLVRLDQSEEKLEINTTRLDEQQAQFEILEANYERLKSESEPDELALKSLKKSLENARSEVFNAQREFSQAQAHRDSASRTVQNIQVKLDRLVRENTQATPISDNELKMAQTNVSELSQKINTLKNVVQENETQHEALKQKSEKASQTYNLDLNQQAQVNAKLNALIEIEEKFKNSEDYIQWLTQNNLHQKEPLLKRIRVTPGWEKAIESALRETLDALLIDDLSTTLALADSNLPKKQSFLSLQHRSAHKKENTAHSSLSPLSNVIECASPEITTLVGHLLSGIYQEETLEKAFDQQSQLGLSEKIMVPNGHVVTAVGVNLYACDNEQAGRLERLQQIEMLQTELRALEVMSQESLGHKKTSEHALQQSRDKLQQLRQQLENLKNDAHKAQLKLVQLQEAFERSELRVKQFEAEREQLQFELEAQQALIEDTQVHVEATEQHYTDCQQTVQKQQNEVAQLEQKLAEKQTGLNEALQQQNQQSLTLKLTQSVLDEAQREHQFAQSQVEKIKNRRQEVLKEIESTTTADSENELQNALHTQTELEQKKSQTKQQLDDVLLSVSELEKQVKQVDQHTQPLRDKIQDWALKIQAAEIAIEQNQTNLDECGADSAALIRLLELNEHLPKASHLQAEVTRLTNAMQALGPVNLAALDELNSAQERKTFLDQQMQDLHSAIDTLQEAIVKIDRETRDLLGETFKAVNAQFSQLFPQLFGGGQARLVMTGDEILDAGVQVVAQPPGKKNGTIHLLSGGEKALTATALVFAIFELNPAPFCLLDEVDAPLDDANTLRFSNLVKQMSERTQFLFISHNKITMEIAQQLIGVTMQEEGVSRIVAVDMATAEQLATETL